MAMAIATTMAIVIVMVQYDNDDNGRNDINHTFRKSCIE